MPGRDLIVDNGIDSVAPGNGFNSDCIFPDRETPCFDTSLSGQTDAFSLFCSRNRMVAAIRSNSPTLMRNPFYAVVDQLSRSTDIGTISGIPQLMDSKMVIPNVSTHWSGCEDSAR